MNTKAKLWFAGPGVLMGKDRPEEVDVPQALCSWGQMLASGDTVLTGPAKPSLERRFSGSVHRTKASSYVGGYRQTDRQIVLCLSGQRTRQQRSRSPLEPAPLPPVSE